MIKDRGNKTIATKASGVVAPEGVSFDGVTDYLSRSTDLVGNVDSKTFTFSCWVYVKDDKSDTHFILGVGDSEATYLIYRTGKFTFQGYDSSVTNSVSLVIGTQDLDRYENHYVHLLISFDLTDTNKRHVYVNDIVPTNLWDSYSNIAINFAGNGGHYIGTKYNAGDKFKGRLSNLFLDYTYRDLSIEANRRLFITADGKPADGLASLSPILYLPMTDASTAHINEGTGGNFVQNGLIETADRGANQDNCVASKFDGIDDEIYKATSGMGMIDGKQITVAYTSKTFTDSCFQFSFSPNDGSNNIIDVNTYKGIFAVELQNSAKVTIFNWRETGWATIDKTGIQRSISLSIDLTDTNKTRIYVDGVKQVNAPTVFTNDNIWFNAPIINTSSIYGYGNYPVELGELYFDTTWIDTDVNNPFWDTDLGKPIPVREVMALLGSNPLICCPLDASNPTKNYGSGGDFTLNGGGLVGARGASEFITRSAKFNATLEQSLYVQNFNTVDSKTFSFMVSFKPTSTTPDIRQIIYFDNGYFEMSYSYTSKNLYIKGKNTSGTTILDVTLNKSTIGTLNNNSLYLFSFDLSDVAKKNIYESTYLSNLAGFVTFTTYTDDFIDFTRAQCNIGAANSTNFVEGDMSILYFTTDYIDFSLESNRNLFVNQLGYPRDLTPLIADATIPTPLIYLPFDDTSNLGKNLGTGGDFTKVGTVTAGADFTI